MGHIANSADPDQTPKNAAPDQGPQYLLSLNKNEKIPHNNPKIENGLVQLKNTLGINGLKANNAEPNNYIMSI